MLGIVRAVFVDISLKAKYLHAHPSLTAWLDEHKSSWGEYRAVSIVVVSPPAGDRGSSRV